MHADAYRACVRHHASHLRYAIDMPGNEVPAEWLAYPQCRFKVYGRPGLQLAERRQGKRLARQVAEEAALVKRHYGETHTLHTNAVAVGQRSQIELVDLDVEAHVASDGLCGADCADVAYDSREHGLHPTR